MGSSSAGLVVPTQFSCTSSLIRSLFRWGLTGVPTARARLGRRLGVRPEGSAIQPPALGRTLRCLALPPLLLLCTRHASMVRTWEGHRVALRYPGWRLTPAASELQYSCLGHTAYSNRTSLTPASMSKAKPTLRPNGFDNHREGTLSPQSSLRLHLFASLRA